MRGSGATLFRPQPEKARDRERFDAAVIGAGIAGMATALRLQAGGLSTVVLEAHGQPGGCAGFYRRKGFAFDVGATTLVDFGPEGVGGELLASSGFGPLDAEDLPGYVAWLPDRRVTLHRDPALWREERLRAFGHSPGHLRFWKLLDRLAGVFWSASRRGVKLPLRSVRDLANAAWLVGPRGWSLTRYLRWTLGDALRSAGIEGDRALRGLLSMLVEDTVHATIETAPLVNAALGISIRGAGLARARGGMRGFWRAFVQQYRRLGGTLRVGCAAAAIRGRIGSFVVDTSRGPVQAAQIVSAVPIALTARLAPPAVQAALRSFVARDAPSQGGACSLSLGVPAREVADQPFTHHQLLERYGAPLGNGNNMFISVSAPGDVESAPEGYRAVTISTHCELGPWSGPRDERYRSQKEALRARLLGLARRVYPDLGRGAVVSELSTPLTYARFTRRPRGAVGGVRLTLSNANQQAVPQDTGVPGFWLAGDTTWPGLGTVAGVLGSRIVARGVRAAARTVPAR